MSIHKVQSDLSHSDSFNDNVYVANFYGNSVSKIHNNEVVATIPVGINPFGVAYDPANNFVCVTNLGANTISLVR